MAIRTSLNDLLESRLGDVSDSTLDHMVSRDHQNKIALSVTDWRSIAPFLGLEETDEEDIEAMYSTIKTKNIAMLRKWKHLHGSSATYRRLLGAFWDVGRIDLIDELLEMVATGTPPSLAKDQVETKDNEAMIYVKTLSGQRIVLEVIATDTVEDVKTMLQHKLPEEERVESKKLRLIFQGRELSNERLLCEYGIQNHSTVYQRLQTGTIQLCISLPDLGKFLSLTVKPANTFNDIVHRVVALERTLLLYQHLLVTLRGRSTVQLTADRYVSVVGDYDLKSEDTVELVVCKEYCHSLQVTLPSHRNLVQQLQSERNMVTLKLHSHDTFIVAETLIKKQRALYRCDYVIFYSSEVMLKREHPVGLVSRCSVYPHFKPIRIPRCALRFTRMFGTEFKDGLGDEVPLVLQVERRVENKAIISLRPSGSAVVYIDHKLMSSTISLSVTYKNQMSLTLYLPDNHVSIFIIKELMREKVEQKTAVNTAMLCYSEYNIVEKKVQLFQNDMKLTDDIMLSECMSTKTEYNGCTVLTYHLTAITLYGKPYSVHYLNLPVKGYTAVCKVKVFNDTIADLKVVIEESSGIPQQNQALYTEHKFKLYDHQVVRDFVCYSNVYLDVRLLVVIKARTGVTIPFEVLSCDNVLSLKRMITIETNIPVEDQTLLLDHTVLENTKSVGAYVGDNKLTLHVTLVVSKVFCCIQ